jgi:hypothetical protein
MGLWFSCGRTAIRTLAKNQMTTIDDVKRNGHTFSDGVGVVSAAMAREISDGLKLSTTPSAFQVRAAGHPVSWVWLTLALLFSI